MGRIEVELDVGCNVCCTDYVDRLEGCHDLKKYAT